MVPKTLLDSDILSSLLKNHPKAVRRALPRTVSHIPV